jgi:TPR repeat protein
MRKLLLILVLAVMCSSIARAGEMDAGAAYDKGNYAKALVLMNELAAKRSPFGQFFLGQMYRKGAGVTQDLKKQCNGIAWPLIKGTYLRNITLVRCMPQAKV